MQTVNSQSINFKCIDKKLMVQSDSGSKFVKELNKMSYSSLLHTLYIFVCQSMPSNHNV